MDKIKVNNQVVLMRRFIKQAKTRAINKCTKQIKFLENRKGKEEQMVKAKRKLQRLLEEVIILKKIKPDSVSKLALSKAKDWKAVLAEKNIPLEERCIAMLANHPPVQESVEKFHNDNPELVSKISEIFKKMEESKKQNPDGNKKKQKRKQDNTNNPNKLPIGNKTKFQKSNETEIKHPNTESLENPPDSSGAKSIHTDMLQQNLKIKKTDKRKRTSNSMSDNLDSSSLMNSPTKKKLLVLDCTKSNDSISENSGIANYLGSQNKEELPVKDEIKTEQSYNDDSNDSLSGSSDIANFLGSQNKEELPVKDEMKTEQSYNDDSNDSLSGSSDATTNRDSQDEEKLPAIDKSCKNSKQPQTRAKNLETSLDEKIMLLKKETTNGGNRKEINVESSKGKEGNSGKSKDIRSKLLDISLSKSKAQNKPKNKSSPFLHQLNAGVETDSDDEGSACAYKNLDNKPSFPAKPEVKNKMKAIAMLDLDKLQDVDEIPIEKSGSETEDETSEDAGKQKKDPFFLRNGEPVSESDEDEISEKETARKKDFPSFKKKPYANFNRREQRDNSFQKRKFDKFSLNGKNSNFKEKGFPKNKEFSFKDNKRNFKPKFGDNSEFRQNKKQFSSKDKFNNKNGTNSFARNQKEKACSQTQNRNAKGNSYPPKSSLGSSQNTIKPDDKPLHPSWEAKRKLKEAGKVVFQGKRMVF